MSQRHRLHKLAEALIDTGVSGGDMQSKLAELVQQHDLSGPEISRIVEKANRDVQLALYKTAEDKRFAFKLAQAGPAIKMAQDLAQQSFRGSVGEQDKIAAAIDEAGGDPFAAPTEALDYAIAPEERRFSLYDVPVDAKLAFDNEMHSIREHLLQLDSKRAELEALVKEARAADVEAYGKASQALDMTVQSALDLIGSGIKLPSLAGALYAAVSGSRSGKDACKHTDQLLTLIVQGLKNRGIPNHRLGFHWDADIDAIEDLSVEDIVALAKRSANIHCAYEGDITIQTQKRAQRYLESVPEASGPTGQHPFLDASDYLQSRPSVQHFGVPETYLDSKNVDNLHAGAPKVVDGDSEFVIGIQDLMGAHDRKQRVHAAQEYLGLKIKQIEGAMRKLEGAKKTAEARFAEYEKQAAAPLALPAIKGVAAMAKRGLGAIAKDTAARTVTDTVTNRKKEPTKTNSVAKQTAAQMGGAVVGSGAATVVNKIRGKDKDGGPKRPGLAEQTAGAAAANKATDVIQKALTKNSSANIATLVKGLGHNAGREIFNNPVNALQVALATTPLVQAGYQHLKGDPELDRMKRERQMLEAQLGARGA